MDKLRLDDYDAIGVILSGWKSLCLKTTLTLNSSISFKIGFSHVRNMNLKWYSTQCEQHNACNSNDTQLLSCLYNTNQSINTLQTFLHFFILPEARPRGDTVNAGVGLVPPRSKKHKGNLVIQSRLSLTVD